MIRWKEGVFARPGRRSKRAMNIGDLLVIAKVLRDGEEDGWVYFNGKVDWQGKECGLCKQLRLKICTK